MKVLLSTIIFLLPMMCWSWGVDSAPCTTTRQGNLAKEHFQAKYYDSKGNTVLLTFGNKEECKSAQDTLISNKGVGKICGCELRYAKSWSAVFANFGGTVAYEGYLVCHSFDKNGISTRSEMGHWDEVGENPANCEDAQKKEVVQAQPISPKNPATTPAQNIKDGAR